MSIRNPRETSAGVFGYVAATAIVVVIFAVVGLVLKLLF